MTDPAGDCRTEEGVIVGLVDGMIAQSRVVAQYIRRNPPRGGVLAALTDLRCDDDVALVAGFVTGEGDTRS